MLLLIVFVCCYAKAQWYHSCSYAVTQKFDAIIRVRMLICETSMLLLVLQIMFVLIRVFRELGRRYGLVRVKINYAYSSRWKKIYATLSGRGCKEIVFEHLEQLASLNLDSHSQESFFGRFETLYNTFVSVRDRWDNIIMLLLNDRRLVKVF